MNSQQAKFELQQAKNLLHWSQLYDKSRITQRKREVQDATDNLKWVKLYGLT